MRKLHMLTVILLLNSKCSLSQNFDSALTKYTYLLVSQLIGTEYIKGSCFFVEKNNKIFFITAAHVNKPWNPIERKMYYDIPDTFYIKFLNKNTKKPEWYIFNNKGAKSDTAKYTIYDYSDLFIAEVSIPKYYEINTVNKYLKWEDSLSYAKQSRAFAYGYSDSESKTHAEMLYESPLLFTGKISSISPGIISATNEIKFNRLNYTVSIINDDIMDLKGLSGAPIFLKAPNSQITFGGLIFARTKDQVCVIRPEFIFKRLLELSSIKKQ